jgi:hypothetical protein
MSEKVQLTVSGIQGDLNAGLTRVEIQAKYGLSGRDIAAVFKHPKLKGLKTKPALQFTLIDDTEEEVVVEVQAEVPVEVVPEVNTEYQTPSVNNDFTTNMEMTNEFQ